MKLVWDAKNVTCGMRVKIPTVVEECMIGYFLSGMRNDYAITSLSDGQISERVGSKQELAEVLTERGYWPLKLLEAVLQAKLAEFTI